MKLIPLSILSLVLSANLFSAETKSSDRVDLAGLNEMQRFYYNKGAEDAKEKAYNAGYKQAMDNFTKKILPAYAQRIKAYEAGKYLIKEGKITYPKVFRYKEGDSYRIQIEPPVVEKQFTEKDLYILPEASKALCVTQDESNITPKDSENGMYDENSFSVPPRDDISDSRDSAPEVGKNKVIVHIPYKNEGIEQAVISYNINYAITKDGYDLYFANELEKSDFCFKITGNGKCQL
jgi:hypothetical protein